MPRGCGSADVNVNASAMRPGGVYVPRDHVTSSGVRSRDNIIGGATKSSASAVSPALASHGNSPSTKNVVALADWKCLNVVPLYCACRTPDDDASCGTDFSTTTSFQWPSYSVR